MSLCDYQTGSNTPGLATVQHLQLTLDVCVEHLDGTGDVVGGRLILAGILPRLPGNQVTLHTLGHNNRLLLAKTINTTCLLHYPIYY